MVRRYYSSNARETELTGSISNSDTSLTVASTTGYPASLPFEIHVELGTSNEEIMLVTAVAGSTFTVTRGYDSSTAVSHSAGARVVHGVSAIDFTDTADHLEATSSVHGVTGGNLVGTTQTQTLSNKTLTSPTINGGTWNSPTLGSGATIPSATLTTPAITNPTITSGGSWAGSPTINTPTITVPTIADLSNMQHDHTSAAEGGTITSGGSLFSLFQERSTSQTITSGSFQSIANGTLSYTSPSAWPTGASRLVLNMAVHDVAYDGSPSGLRRLFARFLVDGVSAYPSSSGSSMYVVADSSLGQTWSFTYSWFIPLPSTSASHSIAAQIQLASVNGVVGFSQLWAYPI
jgi:hypothetical protein